MEDQEHVINHLLQQLVNHRREHVMMEQHREVMHIQVVQRHHHDLDLEVLEDDEHHVSQHERKY